MFSTWVDGAVPRQRSLRLVGAVVAGLALAGSATAAGRGRDTGPTHAAVEVYDDGGAGEVVRLAVADLRTGALVTLRTGNIDNATWSPGGTLLAFAVDGGLAVYRLSGEANTPAAVRLVLDVSGPYGPEQVPQLWPPRPVWSADGARLAHQIGDEVVVYDVSADTPRKLAAIRTAPGDPDYQFAPVGQSLVITDPDGYRVFARGGTDSPRFVRAPHHVSSGGGLAWMPDGRAFASCWRSATSWLLLVVDVSVTQPVARELGGAFTECQVLGARQGSWLVEEEHERVRAVAPDGTVRSLFAAGRDRFGAPYLVKGYRPASDSLIIDRQGSDRDPTAMFLVTLASGRRRPWLRQYRFISDETLSSDERWVLFSVHRAWDDDLNAVYLAGADGSAPRRVLRPLAESRTYGRCVLRPRP